MSAPESPHPAPGQWGGIFDAFAPAGAAAGPEQLASFLGRPCDERFTEIARYALPTVVQMAKSYTRGNGFDSSETPHPEIVGVILLAAARLITNPAQLEMEQTEGYAVRGSFNGFTLGERIVLDRFRVKAG